MIENEQYVLVERWDGILGGWVTVSEAKNAFDAQEIVDDLKNRNMHDMHNEKFSVVEFKRTLVN